MKHSNKIVVCGHDEHSQRGITRSTDFGPSAQNYCQNWTKSGPLLGSSTNAAEVWRISPLVSPPPSFRVAVPLTRSQHLPNVLPIEADPRSPADMAMSIAHWDSPTFRLDPTNSPRCSSDTHAPRREMAESTRAASREATHWESIPPGTRLTKSFRSQTSRWWMILPCSLNDRRVNTWSCR
jgi:hypothetical protein